MSDKALTVEQEVESRQGLSTTPAGLLAHAMAKGADIDKLSQLMELQQKWEANEARKSFVAAMSDFRAECPDINKTRDGHNCKYAGLAETISAIKPLLAKTGLSHRWEVNQGNDGITVTCILTHVNGHSEQTTMTANADTTGSKNSIQAVGSTISYLERYTLYAILGLASMEVDDDGNASEPPLVECISSEQVASISAMLDELGRPEGAFLKWFNSAGKCNINSISQIPVSWYGKCIKKLEGMRK